MKTSQFVVEMIKYMPDQLYICHCLRRTLSIVNHAPEDYSLKWTDLMHQQQSIMAQVWERCNFKKNFTSAREAFDKGHVWFDYGGPDWAAKEHALRMQALRDVKQYFEDLGD